MDTMDVICTDSLWDHNLTWGNHRQYPMFTECFQDVVLGTVSSIWLLAAFPIYVYILRGDKEHIMDRSWFYQAKMGLTVIQLSMRCNDLLNLFTAVNTSGNALNLANLLAQSLDLIAMLISALLVEMERRRNYVTSVVLTIYWCLASSCGLIVFYCKVMEPKDEVGSFELVSFQAMLACSILQLILHCFAEPSFYQPGKRPSSLAGASFVSRVFYNWANKYVILGYEKTLEDDDFDSLREYNKCAVAAEVFVQNWEAEKKKQTHGDKTKSTNISLFKVLCQTYGIDLIANNVLRCLDLITDVGRPIIIGCLVGFADDKLEPTWKAFVYLFGFLIFNFGSSVNFNYILYQCETLAKRTGSSLKNTLFQKSLKMTTRSRAENTVGEITNLFTEDVDAIKFWMAFIWVVWSVPFEFISYTILLYTVVGNAMFVTLAVLLLVMPLNSYMAKNEQKINKEKLRLKDERIKLLTEVLNGIKILKLYAWELAFGDKILDIRQKELKSLWKLKCLDVIRSLVWGFAPFLMAIGTLAVYVYLDENHVLTARTAFMALSIFGALNGTFSGMPHIFSHFMNAYTSMKRLEKFLNKEEIDPDDVNHNDSDNAVSIEDGQFTWDPKLGACLKDINVDIAKGSLVAIVGKIGYGKSSLLSAILGDIEKDQGTVNVHGRTAYVPQQAWIQNATLKNNILFGGKDRQDTYDEVVEACALTRDLEILTAGDRTEIGEKGINLSGGQKQRVSLARAVYCNADIYLLDDPLSAVDAHVGKHIFEHVIGSNGLLRNKTRVMVTHGTTWLPHVDKIIVMDNGKITEQGHYDELMTNDGAFAQFIKEYTSLHSDSSSEDGSESDGLRMVESGYLSGTSSSDTDEEYKGFQGEQTNAFSTMDVLPSLINHKKRPVPPFKRSISRAISQEDQRIVAQGNIMLKRSKSVEGGHKKADTNAKPVESKPNVDEAGKLMDTEEVDEGNVQFHHLWTYFSAFGYYYFVFALLVFVLIRVIDIWADINIKDWTSDAELQNLTEISGDSEYRHERNTYYMKVHGVLGVAKLLFLVLFQLILAVRVAIAADVLHRNMLRNVLRGPSSFFDTTPVGRVVHRFSGDLEPLDGSIAHNGIQLLECMLNFLRVFLVVSFTLPTFIVILPPVIFVYYFIQKYFVPTRRQLSKLHSKRLAPLISHFSEALNGTSVIRAFSKQEQFIEESANKVDYLYEMAFMNLGIERWLSVRIDFLNSFCVVGTVLLAVLIRESLDGPTLGLALGTASLLHGCLHSFVRSFSQLQKDLQCLEKVEQYTNKETEAAMHTRVTPSENWPTRGEVQITDYSLRYREGLDLVLKEINVSIKPGEKIGIVGRTGAGKSSLTIGLFRLVESAQGTITIDDYDISDVGLFDLRSHLTILPQDPVLFSGTLKDNLDPFGTHSEERIYNALQHAHLKPFVESLPDKLDYQCGEGGQNLSVGQRQLICLARSLLRKSNILVLDEATAAVDMETDELIQTTIKEEFRECTVLTIAHRLNTIIDYDRILVLEAGQVKEFDTPKALLANTDSVFYSMAKESGLV